MLTTALLTGLVAGYGVAIPVGAIGVLLIGLTARTSLRVGAAAALGVATVDGAYALIAVAGGGAVASAVRPVAGPMRGIAAAVLLIMAAHTAITAWRRYRTTPGGTAANGIAAGPSPARAYLTLVGLTALNPATVVYFTALVLGRQATATAGRLANAVFVIAAFVASASWQLVLVGGGGLVGRAFGTPRGRLTTALTSAVVTVALAIGVVAPG
jgi:arginine exporter protein ArgO